jgi:LPXTG-motif cell wall-anchored protein
VLAQTGATPSLAAVAGSVIFAVGIGALWLAGRRPRR